MPDADAIRSTISRYLATFSAGDRDAWLDLFAADATMEDPIGTPLKKGRDEIGAFFDQGQSSADSVELRAVGTPIVCGAEASFSFEARPTVGGQAMCMPVIDVMTFDDDARITTQRAYVDFTLLGPG